MSNNPYNSPSDPNAGLPSHLQRPAKKGWTGTKIALLITSILGGVCLLCCAMGIGGWFFATSILAQAVKTQFGNHPAVQREIGTIETITLKLMKSAEEKGDSREQHFVFDVSGPNGSGQIVVSEQVGDEFEYAELRTDNGVFDLME